MSVLDEIVKAYDIRGTVPDQLNAEVARALGVAFARYAGAAEVLIGRDMRPSGPGARRRVHRRRAAARASTSSTSAWRRRTCVYFAVRPPRPARARSSRRRTTRPSTTASSSASPAPARSASTGSARSRPSPAPCSTATARPTPHAPAARRGTTCCRRSSTTSLSFVDVDALRPLRVVADTANGMGGLVVPAVFERLAVIELEVMYGELDGTFPNHPADPLQPANQRDLRARVRRRRLRHRAGVRRRRRPGVRRRRARRRAVRLDDDGDPRRRRPAQPRRAPRSCTT